MSLRRHLGKLLASIEQNDQHLESLPGGDAGDSGLSYVTEIPWPSMWKFAKFAYIAEEYGYGYDGLDPRIRGAGTPFFVFRRLPDARERGARTRAAFPDALAGGRLPGMRHWPVLLRPVPQARGDVKLLHARIKVDYYGAMRRQPWKTWFIRIPAVFLAFLVVNGEVHAYGLRVGAGLALGVCLLLAASRWFMGHRRKAYQRMLEREGCRGVQDHRRE